MGDCEEEVTYVIGECFANTNDYNQPVRSQALWTSAYSVEISFYDNSDTTYGGSNTWTIIGILFGTIIGFMFLCWCCRRCNRPSVDPYASYGGYENVSHQYVAPVQGTQSTMVYAQPQQQVVYAQAAPPSLCLS